MQVGPPESWLTRTGFIADVPPVLVLEEIDRSFVEQLDFLTSVNADDAGVGICEAQRRYLLSAAKGAVSILLSTTYNSLTSLSDDVVVPQRLFNLSHLVELRRFRNLVSSLACALANMICGGAELLRSEQP